MGDLLVEQDLAGAQNLGLLAFGEHNPFGLLLRLVDHGAHHFVGAAEAALQFLAILVKIDRPPRHAGFHGRLRHRRGLPDQHARIEGLGNDVFAAEFHPLHAIGAQHRIGHVLLGQPGQGERGGALHLVVDGGGADVQGAAENEGEAQHVVDLVGKVGAAGGHDGIRTRGQRHVVGDFRIRVGEGEDDRVGRHRHHHIRRHRAAARKAEEHVGAHQRLGQRAGFGLVGVAGLVDVHVLGAAFVDHALGVAHQNVFPAHAQVAVVGGAGDGAGAGAVEHHLDFADLLADDLERVQQTGGGDDGGAVLIVVEDRDVHGLPQLFLDHEALRRLDVLQVDAAEGRFQHLAGADDLARIFGRQLDIEHVDIGEALEQHPFALHHRLAGQGADIAQAQHRGAIADDPHQVALARVDVGQRRVPLDFETRDGNSGRIGQAQITLRAAGLGGSHRQFAGWGSGMVFESVFGTDRHKLWPFAQILGVIIRK